MHEHVNVSQKNKKKKITLANIWGTTKLIFKCWASSGISALKTKNP